MQSLFPIFYWLHIVAMLATLGVLLFAQFGLPRPAATDTEIMRAAFKMASGLAVLGLIAGFIIFYSRIQIAHEAGASLASVGGHLILTKLGIWAMVAVCLMVGSVKAKKGQVAAARSLRVASLVLIAVASFLGVMI